MRELRSDFKSLMVGVLFASLVGAIGLADAADRDERDKRAGKPRGGPSVQAGAPVPQAVRAERSGSSRAVRDIPRVARVPDPQKLHEVENEPEDASADAHKFVDTSSPDGALQSTMPSGGVPGPIANFQGIHQLSQGVLSGFFISPPDTVGDVGPDHYVQCVNLACQVFAKNGTPAGGAFLLSSLFTSIGGACDDGDKGDPIVLYDPLSDRWLLSQFGWEGATNAPPVAPSHECVAVSQTGDPTGAYHVYDFVIPNGYFNDYPKLGVWPDGYYMTAPLFGGTPLSFAGQGAFVLNRAKMLVGDATAEMIFFDLSASHPGLQRILPADLDGVAPPAGTPNYVATITANEFGDTQDGIRLFRVQPDFPNPAASTFTELPRLGVASYDPTMTETAGTCSGLAFTPRDDIDQPAPATCASRVDAIADRPMNRLAYRNFGTHESLVFSHAADVNATPPDATTGHVSGVRYYELQRTLPGGAFAVAEQATFAPDTTHRWMSSAAIDAQGNIAVGYSVSDATTTFPGVRYAGRLASDPPGGLFQGEATLAAGGRSQTSTGSRWGDYSAMSVDPVDDCTFWYTQEYYDAIVPPGACSATACWQTRIGSFKFPSCVSTASFGTLSGTVTNAATSAPLSGVLVQANGYSAVTNGAGAYSMSVAAGTYTVTASKAGFGTASATGVVVAGSGTTTQNFSLGSGSIAGVVTSAVTSLPIAGALVEATGGAHVLSNAVGAYSLPLAPGAYDLTVSAPGFFPASRTGLVVGTSGVTTANVALIPAPVLGVSSLSVNDSIGNNNGVVDFGECFVLTVTLVNTGTVAATGITATLGTTSPGVVISQGVSPYPNIAAGGGTGANTLGFLLSSHPAATQAGKPIQLTLSLSTPNGPLSLSFDLPTGGGGTASTYAATGPVPIPDNNFLGATLAVPVAGFTQTLSKVKVAVRISHTFSGDLVLRLIGPDNTTVILATQVGGDAPGFGTDCPADANDTTFDDAAATPIGSGTGSFVGSFRPQEPLFAFAGKSPFQVNGSWRLQVVDLGPADIGNIECVTLSLNGSTFGGCNSSDLSITKTDGIAQYVPGQALVYTIVAANAGTVSALGSPVADTFPASLTGVAWTCSASAGSSCAAPGGSGNIATTVDLLAGGTATFTVNASVSPTATGNVVNTASIARGDGRRDPIPGNNSATDDDRPPGSYYTLTPCRLIDTRNPPGPLGGPPLDAGVDRTFQVTGGCGIPSNATAVFLNATIVAPTATGNLRIYPAGMPFPTVSSLNYAAGQVRGNNGVYSLNASGQFTMRCSQASGTANVVVDLVGYFVE